MSNFYFHTPAWRHQIEALEYLMPLKTGALYTDMRTGKTKIMIDLIVNKGFKNTLIVCPDRAMDVWESEFSKHSKEGQINVINLRKVAGNTKSDKVLKKRAEGNSEPQEALIVSYDSIWREPFQSWLLKQKIDAIICDESHRIKTPSSKRTMSLIRFSKKAACRYLVTGTPLAQRPTDIYAQYKFMDSTIFGTNFTKFKAEYENVNVEATKRCGFTVLDKKEPYINLKDLHDKMFSCAFYAKTSLKLPNKKFVIVKYDMPKKYSKQYKLLGKEKALEMEEGATTSKNAIAMVGALQQLTSGYLRIIDDDGNKITLDTDDTRKKVLRDMLEDFYIDEPLVIFVLYRKCIDDIRAICKASGRTCSEVSGKKDELLDWTSGKTNVLIAQLQTASESIDLTRARYCIYYNLTHALATFQQSVKRIHGPNQKKPVTYYIIAADRTVDTLMYSALKQKKDLVALIMSHKVKI